MPFGANKIKFRQMLLGMAFPLVTIDINDATEAMRNGLKTFSVRGGDKLFKIQSRQTCSIIVSGMMSYEEKL